MSAGATFDGQVVVVTGGTRGIGAAIVTAFLEAGADVIATGTSVDDVTRRNADANRPSQLRFDAVDLSDTDSTTAFCARLQALHVRGATLHHLQCLDVRVPLHRLVAVAGVTHKELLLAAWVWAWYSWLLAKPPVDTDYTELRASWSSFLMAQMALGMGAQVTMMDINLERLRTLSEIMHGRFTTWASNPMDLTRAVRRADLVIGAVLVKGAKAPKLITRQMVSQMKKGSVIVDVAVDQGGCVETSHPTTHSDPIFFVEHGSSF